MGETTDTGDETLDNSINGSIETPNIENATNESATATPQQETEHMDIHAHHLHHAPGKKIWHYLYEFLMLFLAVFCGFLAEYKLEHVIEHQKGIQYIHSLEEDIRVDTAKLSELVTHFEQKQSGLDSMLGSIKGITSSANSNGLYNYLKYTIDYSDFIYTDRTMQQLKNSGGLRMIPDAAADSIVMYDAAIKRILLTEELELNPNQQSIKRLTSAIFDLSIIPDFESRFSSGRFDEHIPLLKYDKDMLKEYYNEIWIMKRKVGQHARGLIRAKLTAKKLLEFLKEKY